MSEHSHKFVVSYRMYQEAELLSKSFFTRPEAEAHRNWLIEEKDKHPDDVAVFSFQPSCSYPTADLLALHERLHRALDVEDISKIDEDWDGWKLLSDWSGHVFREVASRTGRMDLRLSGQQTLQILNVLEGRRDG
jgi:hypothetical protein